MSFNAANVPAALHWVSEDVRTLFVSEIANEANGGVSPATVSSTIDSIAQGLPFPEGTDVESVLVSLLMIRDLLPGHVQLRDLLADLG